MLSETNVQDPTLTGSSRTLWTDLLGAEVRWHDVKGVRTRIIEVGEGPPLLLLHGISGHAESFARNVLPLSRHCRVMAVDMLGHGFTDKPDIEYSMDALVGHVADVIETCADGKASIMGQSLGGWVGCWLAIRRPELVDRLILDVSAGLRVASTDEEFAKYQANARNRTKGALEKPTRAAVRERLEWLVHDPASITDELVDVRMRVFEQNDARRALNAITDALTGPDHFDSLSLREEQLKQISAQTFVVWSKYNVSTSWQEAETASRIIPNAEFHLIDGAASHWPQWEQPEEFNQVVGGWLASSH